MKIKHDLIKLHLYFQQSLNQGQNIPDSMQDISHKIILEIKEII